MKLGKLIELFRNEVDDTVEPYLWGNPEAMEFAVDAENEACRRARLIVDSATVAICSASAATTGLMPLDSRVIFTRRVRLAAAGSLPLARKSYRDMDDSVPGWEEHTGTPIAFITDYQTGSLRMYPKPLVTTAISLTVIRLPLAEMNDIEDTPEIHSRYHRSLLGWMKYRAYMKKDSETFDEKEAMKHYAIFEREFGKFSSAAEEEWIEKQQQADQFDGTY